MTDGAEIQFLSTLATVREARQKGQRLMLQAVVLILGKYPFDTPEHAAGRAAMLTPILDQNEAIRQYLRSRRAVQDVNPETGEVVADAPIKDEKPE